MFSHYLYTKALMMKKKILIKAPLYLIITYLIKTNITVNVIYNLIYILSIFTGGTVMAALIVSKSLLRNPRSLECYDSEDEEYSEYEKYNEYINNYYEEFRTIFNDEKSLVNYKNTNKKFIKSLKEKDNHLTVDLPYSHNDKLIMFYDSDIPGYIYYTKTDVDYKILNSVCRNYVLTNKCINLFTDDEELEYIKKTHDLSLNDNVTDEKNIEEKEEEETGFISIFYSKKKNKKVLKIIECNKFIYRGNLLEYEKIYNKDKNNVKEISYGSYIVSKND